MKVLIDTNVIVDVALEREPFYAESDRILTFNSRVNQFSLNFSNC